MLYFKGLSIVKLLKSICIYANIKNLFAILAALCRCWSMAMAVVGLLWETVGSLVRFTREVGCRKNNKLGFFRWLVFCLWIVYLTQALHPNKKWKEWENFECEESWTLFHKLSFTSPNFLIHFFSSRSHFSLSIFSSHSPL